VLSLVPTQLQRLLAVPDGVRWLAGFALIWVGGAALPQSVAQRCRNLGLRLSPCYGSTETGAMVMALPPERFLEGDGGCGLALPHAQLRAERLSGALQIKAPSLAAGLLHPTGLQPLPLDQGWWTSGDRAVCRPDGWHVLGRLDDAFQSGAETVFPDQVALQLLELARFQDLSVGDLLLLPQPDPLWGARMVALVQPSAQTGLHDPELLPALQALALQFPASQRPRRWLLCPTLHRNAVGKWDRAHWTLWLDAQLPPES
jgi:O-succinylbenzoic acid--CoA ligase